jgi:hypothetical protein
LDPARDLRITVNSFLTEGCDGVSMLRQGRQHSCGMLDLDAMEARLSATHPSPDPTSRIRRVD